MGHGYFADDPQGIGIHSREQIKEKLLKDLYGFHFANHESALFEKGLIWIIPPDMITDAASHATSFIQKTLDQCSNDWRILETDNATVLWDHVAASVDPTETIRRDIRDGPFKLCCLTAIFLKARQQYIVRQMKLINCFDMRSDVKYALDAAAQRLLDRVESLADSALFSLDKKTSLLTEEEKSLVRKQTRTLGPTRQTSSKSFVLSEKAPQSLVPIKHFGHKPASNLVALRELMFSENEKKSGTCVKMLSLGKDGSEAAASSNPVTPPKIYARRKNSTLDSAAIDFQKEAARLPRNGVKSEERYRSAVPMSGGIRKRSLTSTGINPTNTRAGATFGSPTKKRRRGDHPLYDKLSKMYL